MVRVQLAGEAKAVRRYQQWALLQIQAFEKFEYQESLESIHAAVDSWRINSPDEYPWSLAEEFPSILEEINARFGLAIEDYRLSPEETSQLYKAMGGLGRADPRYIYDETLARHVVSRAMAKFLLPIEESLLDRPVHVLYSRAYQRGQDQLEGHPDELLWLAQQAALVEKHAVEETRE